MQDQLSQIDQKIIRLKQKKESLQTKLALSFMKEAQKIIGDDSFTPELALTALSHSWKDSSSKQREEWQRTPFTFLHSSQKPQKDFVKNSEAHP